MDRKYRTFQREYQITNGDKLEEKLSYNLSLYEEDYSNVEIAGEKLLCVFTYPMEEDLKPSKLLGNIDRSSQGKVLKNILTFVLNEQATYKNPEDSLPVPRADIPFISGYCCIAYRDFQVDDFVALEKDLDNEIHRLWIERIVDFIREYKPTRIWFLGDLPFRAFHRHILKTQDNALYEEPFAFLGRVFNFNLDGVDIPYAFTLPMHLTGTTHPKWVDTMPYLIHEQKFHLEELLRGKSRYTVSDNKEWLTYTINTLDEFDSFYEKLRVNKITCVDLETANLTRKANTILTIHFSLDGKTAHNLPLFHKESPFSTEEQNYIKTKLAEYFQDGESDYLVFHNAKFDVSVLMAQLELKFFGHRIFDTIGGTYLLGENSKFLTEALGVSVYSLKTLAYKYGCAAYAEGELSKEDRKNMADQKLSAIMEYASKDVIIPYQIHQFQLQEAERRGYTKWKDFILEQLGAMILVFARMEVQGILVDKQYLIQQMSRDGEVGKLLFETSEKFKSSANCIQANKWLVTQKRIVADYKQLISKVKLLSRKLTSNINKLSKPIPVKKSRTRKTEVVQENLLPGLILPATTGTGNLVDCYVALAELLTTDKDRAILSILENVHEFISKNIGEIKTYTVRLAQTNFAEIIEELENYTNRLPAIFEENPSYKNEELFVELQNLTAELKQRFKVQFYAYEPFDEWLFDISKKDSQQILFFKVLGLLPIEKRKDGGGKTNVEFQEEYRDHCDEVQWYDNYTKYKKLMSTYIEGIYERLTQEQEHRDYQEKLEKVRGTEEEKLLEKPEVSDSPIDGRLRASYVFLDVVTGRCVRGDVKVLTDKGEIEIERIVKEKIQCNVLTHEGNWKPVIDRFENGEKEVFELETESGKKVYVTANHPLLTEKGWVELENLKAGDSIKVFNE
jgi:DNA polymerase I-like protein with 3'-5' exonuclease and polymerase domains